MIILASKSELRKLIIESSGLAFKVISAEVDERKIEQENINKDAEEMVKILAVAKAKAIADGFPDDLVIAADTFAVLPNGRRLHKTESLEESIMLSMQQSGKTMKVNTGVAMIYRGTVLTDQTTTTIKYIEFNEAAVRHLFAINKSVRRRNAALGFHVDAPGFTLVEKIEGSYLGAMGLPMDIVRKNIEKIGYNERS